MHDIFSGYHPLVNITYFAFVMLLGMYFMNPICLGISMITSLFYLAYLKGVKGLKKNLMYMLPMVLITAILNPVFNHEGATILFYLKDGNPMTLESIVYGIATATMLVSALGWFACFNEVITSDKLMYLFGRILPSLSLMLSMTLRMAPRFQQHIKKVSDVQKCIGRDVTQGNVIQKMKHGLKIISIMVMWALENAIDTADSMKSRGYGLRGRTAFSIYRLDKRDRRVMMAIIGSALFILYGVVQGAIKFKYYPKIKIADMTTMSFMTYIVYGLLCLMPLIMNIWEAIKWKHLQSKI